MIGHYYETMKIFKKIIGALLAIMILPTIVYFCVWHDGEDALAYFCLVLILELVAVIACALFWIAAKLIFEW